MGLVSRVSRQSRGRGKSATIKWVHSAKALVEAAVGGREGRGEEGSYATINVRQG